MFRRLAFLLVIASLMSGMFSATSHAAVPKILNYQGTLSDSSGKAVNSSVSMTFNIYKDETGGIALWTETQTVSVANGFYAVVLGSSNSIGLPFDTQYYLGVKVSTDTEMTPRNKLATLPYAFRAATADNLGIACKDGEVLGYQAATSTWGCSALAVGAQGVKGDVGALGATGLQGLQGIKGDTGATGPQGPIGVTGVTGPQGIIGAQGVIGPQGPTGLTGQQGLKGDTGATGTTSLTAMCNAIIAANKIVPQFCTPTTLVSIVINPINPSITTGGTIQFSATGNLSDGSTMDITSTAIWSSDNNSIATINSAGIATGVAGGTSLITATSGSKSAKITLITTMAVTNPKHMNTSYVARNGLTVKLNSFSAIDNGSYFTYTANYTQKNNTNLPIDEGQLKLYFTNSSAQSQYGLFNTLYPSDTQSRSYAFKVLYSENPWTLEFDHDNFFAATPVTGSLQWIIPIPN